MKLTREQLDRWVADLRSGTYPQTFGQLYVSEDIYDSEGNLAKPKGYCCLGVLGAQLGISDRDLEAGNHDQTNNPYGIPGAEGFWTLNDSRKMSFDQIADVIEEFAESLLGGGFLSNYELCQLIKQKEFSE